MLVSFTTEQLTALVEQHCRQIETDGVRFAIVAMTAIEGDGVGFAFCSNVPKANRDSALMLADAMATFAHQLRGDAAQKSRPMRRGAR